MKKYCLFFLGMVILSLLSGGCSQETQQSEEPVTLTMFGFWSDKIADSGGPYQTFSAMVKEKLPNIQLEYESFPTGKEPYMDELKRRLDHGNEADILLAYNTSLWNSGKILDLTDQAFVSRYSLSSLLPHSKDGSVYFLPGVGNVVSYAYNADWLAETGLDEPETLDELDTVLDSIASLGYHPFIISYEQTPSLFIKVLAAGYLATPEGTIWLEAYNKGQESMSGNKNWEKIWKRAASMVEKGYITVQDMDYSEGRRVKELSQGFGFMSTTTSVYTAMLTEMEDGASFKLIPFPGEKPEYRSVFSEPGIYIGLSSRLNKPGNEKRKQAALDVLDYISTEEGQKAIRGGSPVANSYMNNVTLALDKKYTSISRVLERGSFKEIPEFKRGMEKTIADVLGQLIRGELTAEEAAAVCDDRNASYMAEQFMVPVKDEVLGTAAEDFPWIYHQSRSQELAITNLMTNTMRTAAGTDIALELGTAVRGGFFKGPITKADIESVIRQDKSVYRMQVTGQQLWDLIAQGTAEYSSSWFIAVSGLRYSYIMEGNGKAGELVTLTLEDGTPIKPDTIYTIASGDNQITKVNGVFTFYNIPAQDTGLTLRGILTDRIRAQEVIDPVLDGRITVLPSAQNLKVSG